MFFFCFMAKILGYAIFTTPLTRTEAYNLSSFCRECYLFHNLLSFFTKTRFSSNLLKEEYFEGFFFVSEFFRKIVCRILI